MPIHKTPGGQSLLEGSTLQCAEENGSQAGRLPPPALPADAPQAHCCFCEGQASFSRKQNREVREKGDDNILVTSLAIHHTSRNRELLDLEWNGSDHILRKSPFK